ncbi:MAG: putative transrane anti-sigma factor [Modestobacter sp.]|nr:putative transrane anti-sigma factor [Modestobacter sp.]
MTGGGSIRGAVAAGPVGECGAGARLRLVSPYGQQMAREGGQLPPPGRETDDDAVARRFCAGDEQALARAYERWAGQVHGMAVRALGPGPDAEDVTRQTFVSAWTGLSRYTPAQGPLPAWLIGICRRTIADTWARPAPTLAAPGPAVPPPPRVWDTIAASTGVTVAPRTPEADPLAGAPVDGPAGLSRRPRSAAPRAGRRWLAVAASLLVGVGVGVVTVALTGSSDAGGPVVARTTLDPLFDTDASGSATVRKDGTSRVLQVDLRAPLLDKGYYEVWLMGTDAQRMVPVGVLHIGDTELPLPEGLDLAAYPMIDVSVEPQDGNPAHSGLSVARGELPG